MDTDWAIKKLDDFLALTANAFQTGKAKLIAPALAAGRETVGTDEEIVVAADTVDQNLDRVFPDWRTRTPQNWSGRWEQRREAVTIARARLVTQEEIAEKLGDVGPWLAAVGLHRWVWEAARSQWASGHYADAVDAAARSVNSWLQNKIGRRDVSEKDLVRQAWTLEAPVSGKPRLRVMEKDGSDTYKSVHEGIADFGSGCFKAIRNPLAHLPQHEIEMSEQVALESLASLSRLARWIDDAWLETV